MFKGRLIAQATSITDTQLHNYERYDPHGLGLQSLENHQKDEKLFWFMVELSVIYPANYGNLPDITTNSFSTYHEFTREYPTIAQANKKLHQN